MQWHLLFLVSQLMGVIKLDSVHTALVILLHLLWKLLRLCRKPSYYDLVTVTCSLQFGWSDVTIKTETLLSGSSVSRVSWALHRNSSEASSKPLCSIQVKCVFSLKDHLEPQKKTCCSKEPPHPDFGIGEGTYWCGLERWNTLWVKLHTNGSPKWLQKLIQEDKVWKGWLCQS